MRLTNFHRQQLLQSALMLCIAWRSLIPSAAGQTSPATIPLAPGIDQKVALSTGRFEQTQYTITVPSTAKQMWLDFRAYRLPPPTLKAKLYVRFGQPVTIENGQPVADYEFQNTDGFGVITAGGALYLGDTGSPALRPGTYYIAIQPVDIIQPIYEATLTANLSDVINQGCFVQYADAPQKHYGFDGGSGSISFSYPCPPIQLNTDVDWISLGPVTDTKPNLLFFSVAPNSGTSPRKGTITIGFTPVTITQSAQVTIASAATYRTGPFAPESVVTLFGSNLSNFTGSCPDGCFGPVSIEITDSRGHLFQVLPFYLSPTQVNFQLPRWLSNGLATIRIFTAEAAFTGVIEIVSIVPELFSADASGQGLAAALVLRVKGDGSQIWEPVVDYDAPQGKLVPRPIDLGPETDQVVLVLFGTGIRGLGNLTAIDARIGGIRAEVLYVGAQPDYARFGLDQINLIIPRSLAGSGEVTLDLNVPEELNGRSNAVRIQIK